MKLVSLHPIALRKTLIEVILDPKTVNLGSVGVALVDAARKADKP